MAHPFDGLLSERVIQILTMLCSRSHHAALRNISDDSLSLLNGIVCVYRQQNVVTAQVITAIGPLGQRENKQQNTGTCACTPTPPHACSFLSCSNLLCVP